MFDIGFSELLVVFVVALLILGPERLPHAAKTAGLWVRKIRRSINSVQREINAQLDHEELQQKINETNQRLLKEGQAIQNTITPYPEGFEEKKDQLTTDNAEPLKAEVIDAVKIEPESNSSDINQAANTSETDLVDPEVTNDTVKKPDTAISQS